MKRALLILFCLALAHPAFAVDPPALEKTDAKQIMESMSWTEVTIVAVRQGVDANGVAAPIYATVVGLGKLRGERHSILQTLYFDKDLDWHFIQLSDQTARVWNKNGFQEIKPWASW
jgi:hypothetical protein